MMPSGCLDVVLFPHTADVYYGAATQDAWGAMQLSWVYDRTIKCQVVNVYEDSSNDRPMLLENQLAFMHWDEGYVLRTSDNILSDGVDWHTPNFTMITNVQVNGDPTYWTHFATGDPKKFEVRGIMPIMDAWNNLHHYKVTLTVSNDQEAA